MRILMLGQIPKELGGSYTTGVANVVVNLSKELGGLNHDVMIYATNYNGLTFKLSENVSVTGYQNSLLLKLLLIHLVKFPFLSIRRLLQYRLEFGVKPIRHLFYKVLIDRILKSFNPDIIQMHGMLFSPLILDFKKYRIKTVMTFHGIHYQNPVAISSNKKKGINMSKLYLNGSKYINATSFLTKDMSKFGMSKLNISRKSAINRVIPNGINNKLFGYSKEDRSITRQTYDIKSDELVFISVGALTNLKNHIGFIDYLSNNKIKCTYLIIAKKEASETESIIDKKISEVAALIKIIIVDYIPQEELKKYYSAADVYAHPSLAEGQALVVMEALACGLPIIVNHEIKNTIDLDPSYDQFIKAVDLTSIEENIFNPTIDRTLLSNKAKDELNWGQVSLKYQNFFTTIIKNEKDN